GGNAPLGEGEAAAGDAGEGACDGKADPMRALDIDADRFRAQGRVASGAHGIAERREQEATQDENAGDRDRQRQEIKGRTAIERGLRPNAGNAVATPGEVLTPDPDGSASRAER